MNTGYASVGDVEKRGRGRPRREEVEKPVEPPKVEEPAAPAVVLFKGEGIYQFKRANGTTKLFRFVKEVRYTVRTSDAEEIAWLEKQKGIVRV